MPKKEYSVELTKMLNQIKTNLALNQLTGDIGGRPIPGVAKIKFLIPEERKIYMVALEKFAKQQRKLFDKIVNKD